MVKRKAKADAQISSGGQAAGILLLNRWLKAAASIMGADAAAVILSEAEMSRTIARYNIPHAFLASSTTVEAAPYKRDETILLRDCTARPEIHAFLGSLALSRTCFYYRKPLSLDDARTISLVLFGETPLPAVNDRDLAIVDELAAAMTDEVERHYPPQSANLAASLRMTMEEITRWLGGTDLPVLVFDEGLVARMVNAPMRQLLPLDWDRIIDRPLRELELPARGSIEFLFRHALETGVSTPRMDLSLEDGAGVGMARMFRVVGSPLNPVDGDPLLVATIDPGRFDEAPPRPVAAFGGAMQAATAEFLLETLVQRRALRSRKDVSYVTLRSWRQSIRAHQISALKAIKRNAPNGIAAEIAAEMAADINSLFGAGGFRAIVPVPCGHSASDRCLSVSVAQALGRDLNLPVAHVLAMQPEKGSSHPKSNVKRAAMSMLAKVEGPVLLIDDVATSGRHIEEATLLLRASGASVLAIAWIGGDSE
jgi:predicted amidophosphoribosyltransferase